jgi:hypothetical protein
MSAAHAQQRRTDDGLRRGLPVDNGCVKFLVIVALILAILLMASALGL